MMEKIEELLEKPYWVIDILPERVPEKGGGQFFTVEAWFLKDPVLRQKQTSFLLKLNCYYDLTIVRDKEEIKNPKPQELVALIGREYLNILVGESALIAADHTDIYMTLYNPDERMLGLIEKVAIAEGLYVWKGTAPWSAAE
jgi:hypothetical protein